MNVNKLLNKKNNQNKMYQNKMTKEGLILSF